jgi:hypothetical protein
LTCTEATLFQGPAGDAKNPDVDGSPTASSVIADCLTGSVVVKVRARPLALEKRERYGSRNRTKIMARTFVWLVADQYG